MKGTLSSKRELKLKRNRNPKDKFYHIYHEEDVKEKTNDFITGLKLEEHYLLTKLLVKFNQGKLDSTDIRTARGNIKFKIDKLALEHYGKELLK